MKDRVPIAQLLQEALARTGYDAVLLAEFLGQRKLANLRKLIDQARSFDESGIFTLDDFITQLSQFIARQPDEPLAATHPETVDVVRLMSIHQAKGLEFPVVVVADLDRPRRGPMERVAFTPQLGPMVKDPRGQAVGGYDLYRLSESDEEQAELVRLLYVATTRAADYLILSAGLAAPESAKGPWTELLYRHFDPLTGLARDERAQRVAGEGDHADCRRWPGSPWARGAARHRAADPSRRRSRWPPQEADAVPKYLAAVPPDAAGRREYSFSRLSGGLHAHAAATPDAADEDDEPGGRATLDPLGLGTLVHAVLAEIDLARPDDAAALVRRHALRHLGNGDQAATTRDSTSRSRGSSGCWLRRAAPPWPPRRKSTASWSFSWPGRPAADDRPERACKDSSIVSIATRRAAGT